MQNDRDTFQVFLERAEANGVTAFNLCIVRAPEGQLDFYIHPDSKDGETGNYTVNGAFVNQIHDNLAAGSSRKVMKPLLGSAKETP